MTNKEGKPQYHKQHRLIEFVLDNLQYKQTSENLDKLRTFLNVHGVKATNNNYPQIINNLLSKKLVPGTDQCMEATRALDAWKLQHPVPIQFLAQALLYTASLWTGWRSNR